MRSEQTENPAGLGPSEQGARSKISGFNSGSVLGQIFGSQTQGLESKFEARLEVGRGAIANCKMQIDEVENGEFQPISGAPSAIISANRFSEINCSAFAWGRPGNTIQSQDNSIAKA